MSDKSYSNNNYGIAKKKQELVISMGHTDRVNITPHSTFTYAYHTIHSHTNDTFVDVMCVTTFP